MKNIISILYFYLGILYFYLGILYIMVVISGYTIIPHASVTHANLPGANLRYEILPGINFSNSNLQGADIAFGYYVNLTSFSIISRN